LFSFTHNSIVGINEKRRIWEMQNPHDPFNGWQQTPGAHYDPFNKWPQTSPGAMAGSRGGGNSDAKSNWLTNGDEGNMLIGYALVGFGLIVCLVGFVVYYDLHMRYVTADAYNSIQTGVVSEWYGDNLQYNQVTGSNDGQTNMILDIVSVKKGSIHARVHWSPNFSGTTTWAEGVVTANVNHKDAHWKYVKKCDSKAFYLHLTEKEFLQGNSVFLGIQYFAVLCDGTMYGVWFWPDKPNAGPGGEFSLQRYTNPSSS
jgi:hypothetical protein